MEGDTFEMEDQRNWTDASYKTYVRPLALPWPYTLEPARADRQSVTLAIEGDVRPMRPPAKLLSSSNWVPKPGRCPPIGVGLRPARACRHRERTRKP